jgi:hypothetical protein
MATKKKAAPKAKSKSSAGSSPAEKKKPAQSSKAKAPAPKVVAKAASPKTKTSSGKPAPAKKVAAEKSPAQKVAPQKTPPQKAHLSKGPAALTAEQKRDQAAEAVKAALEASKKLKETTEEDEFDPEAFFAASGGEGLFKAHTMRKERVDVNLDIRYRIMEKGPIVHHAELMNLSKTGLCLRTKDVFKAKTVLRIEIPLPHTAELFSVQAAVVWSQKMAAPEFGDAIHTGLHFMPMNQAKQAVINNFIQQRRDEIIMAKIGLDKFTDVVPVAGLD